MEYKLLLRVIVLVLALLELVSSAQARSKQTVYLVTFLRDTDNGGHLQRAAELAVYHVNSCRGLLPDHFQLALIEGDSGCDSVDKVLVSYLQQLYTTQGMVIGMITSSCSESVEVLSQLTNKPGIALTYIHLSMLSSFQNREMYSNTFGIAGSSLEIAHTLIDLIQRNGWKVSVLYDSDRLSLEIFHYLRQEASMYLNYTSQVTEDSIPFTKLKARIIIVLARGPVLMKALCEAERREMVYPAYQWIILGEPYKDIASVMESSTCSLDKALMLRFSSSVDTSYQTDVDSFPEHHSNINSTTDYYDTSALLVYDSVWVLSLALSKAFSESNTCCVVNSSSLITTSLTQVDFIGKSGYIHFNATTGYNERTVNIYQFSDTSLNLVGTFSNGTLNISEDAQFLNISQGVQYEVIRIEVALLFTLVTMIQLLVIIILHIMTVIYRKHLCIRASNPRLSYIIFFGCYEIVLTEMVFLWPLKFLGHAESQPAVCMLMNAWLFPTALTLIFAPLIAHIWRLYRIFTHFRDPGCCISDTAMFIIVGASLGLDVIIAILWSVLTPTHLVLLEDFVTNENGIVITTMCTQDYPYLYYLMWIYKYLQLCALIVLCYLTKNIRVNQNFATSRYKTVSYLIALTSVILVILYFLFYLTNAEIHADVSVLCILTNIFLFLCVCFILFPPVLQVLKEKKKQESQFTSAIIL